MIGAADTEGIHLLPSGRQLIQRGQRQIPIDDERQRPGDGRGRHDVNMGRRRAAVCVLAGAEVRTLFHTETVLFVGNGEGQPGKVQTVAEQGVGSDDEIERTGLEGFRQLPLFPGTGRAGKQSDADPEHAQNAAQRPEMLLRENLGRGHEGGGIARLKTLPDQRGGHQGFAAADVTLKKPAHLSAGGHVGSGFFDGAALCSGGREGERFKEGREIGLRNDNAGVVCFPAAAERTGEKKQLFKDKTLPGLIQRREILRKMNVLIGVFRGHQTVPGPDGFRKQLGNLPAAAVQPLPDALPKRTPVTDILPAGSSSDSKTGLVRLLREPFTSILPKKR